MGQTLTHGIYLPDEGERNCYNGLAANWQILDSSVGTIAAHTAALAGKAPLVHTHTKSDITDFPAYGTTAGTICEGNDSRLSDARTPVAHTHGKADITDLFNSANTWSGDNTYSKAITVAKDSDTNFFLNTKHTAAELGSLPSRDQSITWAFKDKNDDNLCYARVYYETTGGNSLRIFVRNKYTSGAPSTSGTVDYTYFGLKINPDKSKEGILRASFIPYDNNTYDLGSSSYQWNNLYAKNYYYNGVAWGLDKANEWSAENTYNTINLKYYLSGQHADLYWKDENNTTISAFRHNAQSITLGKRYTGKTAWYQGAQITINQNGTIELKSYDGTDNHSIVLNSQSLYPVTTSNLDLGTSTNKWKTLNGINPGALSLPSSDSAGYIDLSSNLSANAEYQYTAPYDGWLCLYVIVNEFYTENAIGLYRSDTSANSHQWAKSATAALNLYKQTRYQGSVMLPVESGKKYICYLSLNANTTVHGKYLFMYKNKGNV